MAKNVKITGVRKVLRNIGKVRSSQVPALERGLKLAGLFLQKESQKVVPVDTGVLRSSAFTRLTDKGLSAAVTVGYTASYAVFVHENLDARHAPGKIAKYLEHPARIHMATLRRIISAELERSV